MNDLPLLYGILVPVAAVAGFVRGFAGFGGPLIMIPVASFLMPPPVAVATAMWVDFFANVRLLPDARHDATTADALPLTVAALVAMPLGIWLLVAVDPVIMKRTICVAVFIAAASILAGWRYRGKTGPAVNAAVGFGSGMIFGATGLAVTVALFVNAGHQTARQARANFIIWVFATTIELLTILAVKGTLVLDDIPLIAVLSAIYFCGTVVGTRLYRRADEALVRRAVLSLVLVIASAGIVF